MVFDRNQTTQYLKEHLKDGESFFAVPYDPLYYFLTNREYPTREMVFYRFLNIPDEQEAHIIRQLEEKRINYILVSSAMKSEHERYGVFGKTHCQRLAQYIQAHFKPVAAFGEWARQAEWTLNHGTMILKRKADNN